MAMHLDRGDRFTSAVAGKDGSDREASVETLQRVGAVSRPSVLS